MRRLFFAALLVLCASAALAQGRSFAVDVGLGPSYGVLGFGLEWKPTGWTGVFGTFYGDDGFFTYSFGVRAYPLGDRGPFNPFVHFYRWGFGIFMADSTESISSSGVGVGGEWVFDSGKGFRLGVDFSSVEGDSVVFPFIAYTEKF